MPYAQCTNRHQKCVTLFTLVCIEVRTQTVATASLACDHTFMKRDSDALMRECAPNMITIMFRYVSCIRLCTYAYAYACEQAAQ